MQATLNGLRCAYADAGKGPALVLVHGFPLSRGAWQPQVEAFQAGRRVIAPDLRGLGESAPGPGIATMDTFADDVHALLELLGTGPVVLGGHSMGGYIALAFLRRHPGMVRGLVLVGTKAGADTPEGAAGRRATAEKVEAGGVAVVVDAMAPKMVAPAHAAAWEPRVRTLMAGATPAGVAAALRGMAERPDSTAMLSTIEVPTLVITGADDVLIPPAESEKLAAGIPGATLAVIPAAGHLVAAEQPESFNRALGDWLTTLP